MTDNKKSNIKKILILRLSSLGDVLLTTPLLRILSKNFPDSEIDYVVADLYSETLVNNPYISNLIIYDKKKSIFHPLKNPELLKMKYDISIDLQYNLRTRILTINKSKVNKHYSKQRLHKLSLIYFKKPLIEDFSVPLNYIQSINLNDIEDDGLGLEFWLFKDRNANKYLPFSKKMVLKNNPEICIAPGAKHYTKRWTIEGFVELINKLKDFFDCKINLVGSRAEVEISELIEKNVRFPVNNYCGKLSLTETAELIDNSDLVISNDSGIMHIAAARRVPQVVIYGSTVPEFGFLPFRSHFEVVQQKLDCRPCSHIGRDKCPKNHFNCMNSIKADYVISKVNTIFNLLMKV